MNNQFTIKCKRHLLSSFDSNGDNHASDCNINFKRKLLKSNKSIFFKLFFLGLFTVLTLNANAQLKVGNNPTSINPSAVLDVEATNKGFLPPRVALAGINDATTIASPAVGLLVINTTAAGTGTNAVSANSLYIWNGTQWDRVVTNNGNSNSASNPFLIGETRTCVIKSDITNFDTNAGSKLLMYGKALSNTTTTSAKAASETAINSPSFIIFRGLRMDFLEAPYWGDGNTAPKFYNTTSNPITYNVSSLSTVNAYINGVGTTIAPGAYGFYIDGNDGNATTADMSEYVNAMITFPDGEWYMCTWHAVQEATTYNFYMTAQRLN